MPVLTVIIPTYNPHPGRLARTLAGLAAQTLPPADWELLVIDNASSQPVNLRDYPNAPANARVIAEPQLGLTSARRRGFAEAGGAAIVMVDDDNVLASDYLARALELLAGHPRVGALGGRSIPEFEAAPAPWVREFDGLLACRDLGWHPLISNGLRHATTHCNDYPEFAPIGAGMVLRRAAAEAWLADTGTLALPDRRGGELSSSGDNDIVLTAMRHGWEVGYFPQLSLTHLIPAGRTTRDYLARLNQGIQKSWMQVLRRHDANPWGRIPAWSVPLREVRAWFAYRAWAGPAGYIRWRGACGHFQGRATP
jgi:glycosyltransferase involved in cell wall biosynthesis